MRIYHVALVSPPINTIKRVYPYANFSDLSFLEVPGYIAGATNPMFQQKDTWWDLLCILDLPNNTAILSYDRQLKLYENGTLLDEIKRYQEKVNESSNDLLSYDEDTILNSYIQPTLNILFDDDANDTIDNSLDISTDSITPINPIDFIP
eukprot:gene19485-25371_t